MPLNDVAKLNSKVKIVTIDERTLKFKRITKEKNSYYGIKDLDTPSKNILLFPNDIQSIKIHDPKKSTLLTASTIGIYISLIILGATGGCCYNTN